jgi:hypothetical protein
VFSELDNIINYTCLMSRLEKFNGEMMLMKMDDGSEISTNFIYVPPNNTKLINEILDDNPDNRSECKHNLVSCNGPSLLKQYFNRISVEKLEPCVVHKSNDNQNSNGKPPTNHRFHEQKGDSKKEIVKNAK